MKPLITLFSVALLFTACNNAGTDNEKTIATEPTRDTVDYKSVIDETNKSFTAAALNGDSAALANLYHPDANVFPPNMKAIDAKQTASLMTSFPKMGIKSFTLHAKEVYQGDDVVTEVGTYEMGDGNKNVDEGKYMVVWKKDGDKWKLFRDIWNSNNPPPPAPKNK